MTMGSSMYLFYNPFPRNFFSFGLSLIPLLTQHPVMLWNTVGAGICPI